MYNEDSISNKTSEHIQKHLNMQVKKYFNKSEIIYKSKKLWLKTNDKNNNVSTQITNFL